MTSPTIRPAAAADAADVSALITHTLRVTNSKDYPAAMIDQLVARFTPEKIAGYFQARATFVALLDGRIVGTAGLETGRMRMVFVHPAQQGSGIGAALVRRIEALARERGLASVWLESSLTAVAFYRKLGYRVVRQENRDGEPITVMERSLAP